MMTFWEFVRERINIYHKKEAGDKRPWTEDRILDNYYFCNIYREWDKTTIWFRKNIREPLRTNPSVILATIIFRWFNRIDTGEILKRAGLMHKWDSRRAQEILKDQHPLVTGAYIIKTPDGVNKLEGLCWCIDVIAKQQGHLIKTLSSLNSLQAMHEELCRYPYLGDFMAYEIVTDLRHTYIGEEAKDIYTWANPGPGAKRGLSVLHPEVEYKPKTRLIAMQRLLTESYSQGVPPMELRDIEHSLCEYSKYVSATRGYRLKRLYRGTNSDGD